MGLIPAIILFVMPPPGPHCRGRTLPRHESEEHLLRQLEELRQELYRVMEGATEELGERERERMQQISVKLDDLVVEVVRQRRNRGA